LLVADPLARLRHSKTVANPLMTFPSNDHEPPRGTIRIVAVFGTLLVLGWLLLYFGLFLPRATP